MARTPAIPMDNPFHGSYEAEGAVYEYHAVIPGSDDHQVKEMTAGGAGDGTIIEGVVQDDANDEESVKVVYFGPTWGYANAAIIRNARLEAIFSATAINNGRFQTIAAGSYTGKMVAGIALEDAVELAKFKIFLTREIITRAD